MTFIHDYSYTRFCLSCGVKKRKSHIMMKECYNCYQTNIKKCIKCKVNINPKFTLCNPCDNEEYKFCETCTVQIPSAFKKLQCNNCFKNWFY